MLLLPAVFRTVNYDERGCGDMARNHDTGYVLIQGCAGHHKEQTVCSTRNVEVRLPAI